MSLLAIADVLSPVQLDKVHSMLSALAWTDGAATAGTTARTVKRNEQADLGSPTGAELRQMLHDAVSQHPVLKAAALPARFSKLMVSRTSPGGGYGLHTDNAFMGSGPARLRTDLSFTLFLSAPETCVGGELEIELAGATQSLKPAAGTLVLYPATSLHRVADVTAGTRLACIGWIQSTVRDAAARDVIFDLKNLRAALAERYPANAPELLTLAKAIANLLRLHGTP